MDEPIFPEQPADNDVGHERADPRDSLFLQATLTRTGGDEAITLRVRNLSAHGMMAEGTGVFADGEAVQVDVRGIGLVAGRIAWNRPPQIGITFDRAVDPKRARKPVGLSGDRDTKPHRPL